MSDDQAKPATPGETPLAKAAERIRGSSQWLIGAFAAVGAVLAAGLQLADIGDLTTDDWWRLIAAIGGILLAVVGIIVAISNAANVSTRSDVSLGWLAANPDEAASKAVVDDVALRQGMDMSALQREITSAVTAAKRTYDEILELGDPGTDPNAQARAKALSDRYRIETARLASLKSVRADVLDVASFTRVKSAYDDAKTGMVVGALVTAVGITAFAWGANAPAATSLDGGEVLPKTPSEVTVILNDAGTNKFGRALGVPRGCDATNVSGIALEVSKTTYNVVSVRTDKCAVVTMAITDDLGKVIPRKPPENPKKGDEEAAET